jgi:hypothetical protein
MSPIRIFGLTAAVAAVFVVATGSASATTLCKINENPCPAGQEHKVPTALEGKLEIEAEFVVFDAKAEEEGVFEKPFLTVKCKVGTFKGETTKNEGAGKILLGTFAPGAFETCTGCTKGTPVKAPYKAEISAEEILPGIGWINITTGTGGGIPAWEFTGCGPLGVTCTFGEKFINAAAIGGNPALVRISGTVTFQAGNPFCQKKASIRAWYELTKPNEAVFVESEP